MIHFIFIEIIKKPNKEKVLIQKYDKILKKFEFMNILLTGSMGFEDFI